ncbi:MAG: glycosyltransferase [Proteobacteria bacterium]|nr:glycosyltransferase [Pseudomonadota bacterium]
MRIVLDLQGAQTVNQFRRIGRHSVELAQAIVRNCGDHEVLIALNGMLSDTIEPVRAAFDGLLPQANIRVWQASGPVREIAAANTWRRQAAELLREAFLASLNPDVVHVSSLFEGYQDDAVTSIGRFTESFPTAVTLYDLIPLFNPDEQVKGDVSFMDYFWRKVGHLKQAQLLLAMSESSRRDAIDALQVSGDSVANISSGLSQGFQPMEYTDRQRDATLLQLGIERPFVLCLGAGAETSSLRHLVMAFAALPITLRDQHQLVVAGVSDESRRQELRRAAKVSMLGDGTLRLLGELEDTEFPALYNLCQLVITLTTNGRIEPVALEAMACGAAVIGANTPGMSEVMGGKEALFDPLDAKTISHSLAQVLADETFRQSMQQRCLQQARKFSWEAPARSAIAAFEQLDSQQQVKKNATAACRSPRRLRLAYVSPLPPERSGIADYSAELIPELARYYDIDVITPQAEVTHPWVRANSSVHGVDWFRANAPRYERVMYHFGNSPFHSHMFDLLPEIPGVVVLHDFFLSGVQWHDEAHGVRPNAGMRELQHAHGYLAFAERFSAPSVEAVAWKYPCNLSVLQQAQGIIVHSEASRELARQWYGDGVAQGWAVVPLPRATNNTPKDARKARLIARQQLGVPQDDFLICSFGILGPAKNNHRLLDAWLTSPLAQDPRCQLVFVGENDGGNYGAELLATIRERSPGARVTITGWVSEAAYKQYLSAADVAVQLRTQTRGETSAAVLDCMNHGLATIVNAQGSMAELPPEAVWMLPDAFTDEQLAEALTLLQGDVERRCALGDQARRSVRKQHAPAACAARYAAAIETFHAAGSSQSWALTKAVAELGDSPADLQPWLDLSRCIAQNHPLPNRMRQLLVDVSALCRNDIKTGIQRVARSVLLELIQSPPAGYAVEPVYARDDGGMLLFRYARQYAARLLGCPDDAMEDAVVEFGADDVLLCPDLTGDYLIQAERNGLLQRIRNTGTRLYYVIFDLLPVLRPEFFPPRAEQEFERWLQAVARVADGVIGISEAVSQDFAAWLGRQGPQRLRPLNLGWFYLGADISASAPTSGHDATAEQKVNCLRGKPSFLMVGTIEPRKGHLQVIAAFEALWAQGVEANLVIVGKEGWTGLPESQRRTIPKIVAKLRNHPERDKRLFWLEGISDDYLEQIYAASTCLIAASEDEGFGLPLIEAALHKLPIVARDIPVFREIAGEHAFYFSGQDAASLADALQDWLQLHARKCAPCSEAMPWLSWKQSVRSLLRIILENEWAMRVMTDSRL